MNVQEEITDILTKLRNVAKSNNVDLYVVGGFIRDLFLNTVVDADIDTLLEGDATSFAQLVNQVFVGELQRFPTFGTAKINSLVSYRYIREIDFASARTELYEAAGKLPTVQSTTIADDLKRRDFTINSMALLIDDYLDYKDSWKERLIDPFDGRKDIEARAVRTLHRKSFLDDPTRMFRAVRYERRIRGAIEPSTLEDLRAAVSQDAQSTISTFRVFSELKKCCYESDPKSCFLRLQELGLLTTGVPLADSEILECIQNITNHPPGEKLYKLFLGQVFDRLNDNAKGDLAKALNISQNKIPTCDT